MNQETPPKGTVRIFGAGGGGINVAGSWNGLSGKTLPGGAACQVVYVDTSRSNLPEDINQDDLYILDKVDGSGKVRAENHVEISRNIRQIVQQFEPGDLNIVCFTASGGSGSVLAPLILSEMIERKVPVVGVVIGSEESNITCRNTINTLKSLESIAKRKGVPVVIAYYHNAPDVKRSSVDIECRYALATLSILASRQNRELDTMDLANFLNFSKVTSVEPQLALLHIYNNPDDVNKASNPVAIASLLKDPDQTSHSLTPEYATVGYPREQTENFDQLHYVITLDGVQTIYEKLTHRMDELAKAAASRVQHDSIVSKDDTVTEDGLIL